MSKKQTKKGIIFESMIVSYMVLHKIRTKEALRARTTIGSNVTMLKYFNNPDCIPIGSFNEIMTALKVPQEERIKIMTKLLEN